MTRLQIKTRKMALKKRKRRKWTLRLVMLALTVCPLLALLTAFAAPSEIEWTEIDPPLQTESEDQAPAQNPSDGWSLRLVNPWDQISADFSVELTQLINGQAIDKRAYPELQQMMDACRAAGLSPLICSSFRTWDKQQSLLDNKIASLQAVGYSYQDALSEASKSVAVPGTSEHQLGLAVDIVDAGNQSLDESQEHTAVQRWLMEHSWEYGFVLRYPNGKSEITGIIYEPWHYRYVGKTAAREMHEMDLCLEEYLDWLK